MPYYALTMRDGKVTGKHESAKPITAKTFAKSPGFAADEVVPLPDGFKDEDEKEAGARREAHEYLKAAARDNEAYLKVKKPTDDERNEQMNKLTEQLLRVGRLLTNELQEA